jgi:type IV secretion system protein VirB5
VLVMHRVALAAVLLLPAAQARAQIVCANCTEELTAQINYVAVAANWLSQLDQMREHYQQLIYTVESLRHVSPQSLTTAAGLLSNAQHLPGSAPGEIPGLTYGTHLSGAGTAFYNQNHYYTPEGIDFAAQEMRRREMATANFQGEAQTSITAINARLAGLNQLQASIPAQPDVTAVAAINARIASEQNFLANEQSHVQQLAMLQQTQQRVDQQRAEQHGRQQLDEWAAAVDGQAWGH